jgi:Zn-dependent protease with chaperone function
MRSAGKMGSEGRAARRIRSASLAALLVCALALVARADRTVLKPGWNLFSPQQDIQIGQQQARQAEQQLPMLNNARVDDYLNQLGQRLASHGPYNIYSFHFKCVNDRQINAFALPGGYVFINRGVIEAADDEAQLAAVMSHEISHVLLRHGTNQASKAYAAEVPLALLGGMMGNSLGGLLAQVGANFAVSSVFLKYSRTDETQADVLGTQILHDSGYDPRAMAQFFEKIEAMNKNQPIQFFSDHPSPENRIGRVDEEIDNLGGPPPNAKTDSPQFEEIKRLVKSLPPPPKSGSRGSNAQPQNAPQASPGTRPELPANQFQSFSNSDVRLKYPQNWQAYGSGTGATLAPQGGIVSDSSGNGVLAYGMIISVFEPANGSGESLEQATSELINQLRGSNPHMSVKSASSGPQIDGHTSRSTMLSNVSPSGAPETDWLVTVMRPDGLHYFASVAPQHDYADYEHSFRAILGSVHFNR